MQAKIVLVVTSLVNIYHATTGQTNDPTNVILFILLQTAALIMMESYVFVAFDLMLMLYYVSVHWKLWYPNVRVRNIVTAAFLLFNVIHYPLLEFNEYLLELIRRKYEQERFEHQSKMPHDIVKAQIPYSYFDAFPVELTIKVNRYQIIEKIVQEYSEKLWESFRNAGKFDINLKKPHLIIDGWKRLFPTAITLIHNIQARMNFVTDKAFEESVENGTKLLFKNYLQKAIKRFELGLNYEKEMYTAQEIETMVLEKDSELRPFSVFFGTPFVDMTPQALFEKWTDVVVKTAASLISRQNSVRLLE